MRQALGVVGVATVLFTISPAFADDPGASIVAPTPSQGSGGAVAPKSSTGLAGLHGSIGADGQRTAGEARTVVVTANGKDKPARPAPTPRVLRKLEVERFVATTEPSVRACVSENKSIYAFSFALAVSVAPGGAVEAADVASAPARVPAPILACVVKAVSAARFGAPGPAGALVTIPISVPGRPQTPVGDRTVTTVKITPAEVATPPPQAPTPQPDTKSDRQSSKPDEPTAAK